MATVCGGGKRDRFKFIHRHGQDFGVKYLCDWLKVSPSGYYAWRNRPESQRAKIDRRLTKKIVKIYHDNRGVYGSPRVHKALKKQAVSVSKKRVERLMQAENLKGRVVKVTRRQPGLRRFKERGENLLLKRPATTAINQVWVADLTYLKLRGRDVFLIVIMDRHSRRILGWSLSRTRTVSDTLNVLKRVISNRDTAGDIIFHTDRGIEFTGHRFRAALKQHEILPSVNRLGFCTDNAHMESFFHSLKAELIRGRSFNDEKELRLALNSYINQFYNHKRLHSGIGYFAPAEYEKMVA